MGGASDSPKSRLRRDLVARRNGVAPEALARASMAVCELLRQASIFRGARHVVTYAARPGEIDLRLLAAPVHASPPAFYYPRVEADRLTFRRGALEQLRPGRFGVLEPLPDAPALAGDQRDAIVLVPAVGFDRQGGRIGTGMGYYDRSLPAYPTLRRIGVALETLIVDRIPTDPWDVPMDAIVTERELLIVGAAGVHPGDPSWS